MWTVHKRGENRLDEQQMSLPTNTSGEVTSLCWHVFSHVPIVLINSRMIRY